MSFYGIQNVLKIQCQRILRKCITVFSILSQLSTLHPPESTELFPPSVYGWLTVNEDGPKSDICATLVVAVTQGAEDW
jgi:hypothetical protein